MIVYFIMKIKSLTHSFNIESDDKENIYSFSNFDLKEIKYINLKNGKTTENISRIPLDDITYKTRDKESTLICPTKIVHNVYNINKQQVASNSSKKSSKDTIISNTKYRLIR